MSIIAVTGFLTASLTLAGIALAFLVLTVGVVSVQYFAENRPVRIERQEPVLRYYRRQLAMA